MGSAVGWRDESNKLCSPKTRSWQTGQLFPIKLGQVVQTRWPHGDSGTHFLASQHTGHVAVMLERGGEEGVSESRSGGVAPSAAYDQSSPMV